MGSLVGDTNLNSPDHLKTQDQGSFSVELLHLSCSFFSVPVCPPLKFWMKTPNSEHCHERLFGSCVVVFGTQGQLRLPSWTHGIFFLIEERMKQSSIPETHRL